MEKLFINGKIFTGNDKLPYCNSMLVEDGIIKSIGEADEICSSKAEVIDLEGKRVIPGIIDAHTHGLLLADYSKQISCLPPNVNSIEELSHEIGSVCKKAKPGQWIMGWGYDEGKLKEHRAPNRYDLDKEAGDFPVFIARTCVHIASVNSKALEIAGIDKNTPDPEGGHIVRDENGEPTGVLQENARNLVIKHMPIKTVAEKVDDIVDLGNLMLSYGIVGFTDLASFDGEDCLHYYDAAVESGLKQDVAIYYLWDAARDSGNYTLTKESMNAENQAHVAGLKLISDGSISGHTAWVDEPYLGTDDCGIRQLTDELFDSALDKAKETGCQLSVHAMGAEAIRQVVDKVSEQTPWRHDGVPCVRMEHITEPREDSIEKAVKNNIWFVMQPIFQYSEIESYLANLGPERTKKVYPIRSLLESGVKIALSTDSPATSWAVPYDPWTNIKAALTRICYDGTDGGREETIDAETAVKLYTREAATVCGFSKLGMLKPGYRASFAVLDKDILKLPPEEVDKIKVVSTYIDGEQVYSR